jgi:DNA-binding NtrC family response regulator
MPTASSSLLIVDDEEAVCFSVQRSFESRGFDVRQAATLSEAEASFRNFRPDVVVVDQALPDGDGLDLLRRLHAVDSSVPFIVLTGHATVDLAVQAMKEGADNFLTKPMDLATLQLVVDRALENRRNRQRSLAGRSVESRQVADPFLGDSPLVRRLAEQARRVLEAASPVLITGETGTGKGLLASWLHRHGPRAEEAFVDINCAGLTREFLETELFGHEKGAFTGAVAPKTGLFEIAHRGTLFMDEVGDMDAEVQPKLLKVIEDRRFRRLGAVRDREVDVRLIAATHRNLEAEVAAGRFRADLFYRIGTLPLSVPPLRERGRDIVLIARFILERIGAELARPGLRLSGAAEDALLERRWDGNVRELRNVLEQAVLLGERTEIVPEDIRGRGPREAGPRTEALSLRAAERRHIEEVLQSMDGDVARTAGVLGISRSALYVKLKKHSIHVVRSGASRNGFP